jgi:PAS domain S-box-containing protein
MGKTIWKRLRSFYVDVPALRPGTVGAYALAVGAVAAATVLRLALDPFVVGVQFITYYPAIVITTVISGFGAGFFCTVLSTAAAAFFVLEPRWAFMVEEPSKVVELILFGPLASYLVMIITRMRLAIEREQVEASKERLQLALDAAQLGWWEYDPLNRVALWSDRRSKEIYEVAEDKTDIEEFTKRVHPDDVEMVWAAIEAALRPTDPKSYVIEYRVQRGDGEVRWVAAHGLTHFEGWGAPPERRAVMLVGTVQDITESKRAEEEREKREREHLLVCELSHRATLLEASKDRLQLALDAALLGWWQYDPMHRLVLWDARVKVMFDVAEDSTDVEVFTKRVHPDDVERVWAAIEAALDPSDSKPYATEFRLRRGEGEVRWVEAHGLVHFEGSGRERRAVSMVGTAQDITERKSREEAQARLAAIVTSSADGIVGKTLDGIVTNWNEAAERIFGYSADEMIGQSIRRVVPSDRQAEEDMILARLAQSKSVAQFETRRVAKDGRTFDASVTISPVRDAEDRVIGAAKIIRDITARKRVEEQVRLLMREANHRAKNMLSLVQAVARQTAAREPEDFVGRFTERLQALSANQDLLTRNEWHGVEIKDLVCAQLAHFADLVGSRIATHGPKLHLNAAAAQAIGLALHELATNAGKYGALSTEMGRVDISWGGNNDIFTMSWTEREGPPVSAPKRHGFGTTVVERMAKKSVDGTVDLDYAPSGLSWCLTCPAANALESQP